MQRHKIVVNPDPARWKIAVRTRDGRSQSHELEIAAQAPRPVR